MGPYHYKSTVEYTPKGSFVAQISCVADEILYTPEFSLIFCFNQNLVVTTFNSERLDYGSSNFLV